MNRRTFLRRVGLGAAATPLASLAVVTPKVDPILRGILERGGRIVQRPEWGADSLWRAEVYLSEDVVGYISKSGLFQIVTSKWPAFQ